MRPKPMLSQVSSLNASMDQAQLYVRSGCTMLDRTVNLVPMNAFLVAGVVCRQRGMPAVIFFRSLLRAQQCTTIGLHHGVRAERCGGPGSSARCYQSEQNVIDEWHLIDSSLTDTHQTIGEE